ncbi:hypothetical protein [Frankia sp. AgKG'84/4]|nr:hypothetical protein [Frankia sp. AgKG'84/4]
MAGQVEFSGPGGRGGGVCGRLSVGQLIPHDEHQYFTITFA